MTTEALKQEVEQQGEIEITAGYIEQIFPSERPSHVSQFVSGVANKPVYPKLSEEKLREWAQENNFRVQQDRINKRFTISSY